MCFLSFLVVARAEGDSGDMTAHPQSPEHPLCQETRDGFLREDKNNIWPAAHG